MREHTVLLQPGFMNGREYLPELERARAARDKTLEDIKDESMARLAKDIAADKQRNPALSETWEEEEVDEDGGDNVIGRCESPPQISKPDALLHGTLVQPKALGRENTSTSPDKRGTGTTQTGPDQVDWLARIVRPSLGRPKASMMDQLCFRGR